MRRNFQVVGHKVAKMEYYSFGLTKRNLYVLHMHIYLRRRQFTKAEASQKGLLVSRMTSEKDASQRKSNAFNGRVFFY